MNQMTNGALNTLRGRARRRGIDFAKSRRVVTEENQGGFRVWRIDSGEILAGVLWDATDLEVRDLVEKEISRLDALAGRYRKPRRHAVSGRSRDGAIRSTARP